MTPIDKIRANSINLNQFQSFYDGKQSILVCYFIFSKTHLSLANDCINYIIVFLTHRGIAWYGQIGLKPNIEEIGSKNQSLDNRRLSSDDIQ